MRKLILFTLLVAWPSAALSQQIYGRLEGAANDAQGLVLPGVTVTLESEELVAARTATTDVDGSYRFAQLVAGSYNMTFELGALPRPSSSRTSRSLAARPSRSTPRWTSRPSPRPSP